MVQSEEFLQKTRSFHEIEPIFSGSNFCTITKYRYVIESPKPAANLQPGRSPETRAEEVAFDVAEEAASIEELRSALELLETELKDWKEDEGRRDESLKQRLEARRARLESELEAAEAKRSRSERKA